MPTPDLESPTTARPRRLILSVRGLMLLIAVAGLAMALVQFWLANRDPQRAAISRAIRTLADPESPAMARRSAIDTVSAARGRQARRALKLLDAARHDPDDPIRADAVGAIGAIGLRALTDPSGAETESARLAASIMVEALGDPDPTARTVALHQLYEIERSSRGAKVAVIEAESALPAVLAYVGRHHVEAGGVPRGDIGVYRANLLALRFIGADRANFAMCARLAADGESDRERRGAILCLEPSPWIVFPDGARAGVGRWISDSQVTSFLVDRLRDGPRGDRRAILHVLGNIDRRAPILAEHLEPIAAAANDPEPRVRSAAAHLLLAHKDEADAFLPALEAAAWAELDEWGGADLLRALLTVAPGSATAEEIRSASIESLARSRDEERRRRCGQALLGLAIFDPESVLTLLPELGRIADREAADPALSPVAAALVFMIAPRSAEVDDLRSALAASLLGPMADSRRSQTEDALRLADQREEPGFAPLTERDRGASDPAGYLGP